jgi:hypothetical protein
MTYRFLNAFLPIEKSPDSTFRSDFQELLNVEFYNSTDAYTIQEEYPFGSGELVDVEVRINHTINTKTGLNRGDDYKTILFKDITHATGVGYLYYFDENYWIVINSEKIKNLAASAVVKRCNNTLRWIEITSGKVNTVPCAIEYLIKQNRDYSTAGSSLVSPSGTIEVITQFNATSNKIQASQRFLFGNKDNWQGFKIMGGGINNFVGLKTSDTMSTGLIIFSMYYAQKGDSEIDDLTNGIADVGEYLYVLTIPSTATLQNGKNLILTPSLTLNGISNTASLTWSTSKASVATVNSSGLVTSVGIGSATITCSMTNNPAIADTCAVTVSASTLDTYEIRVTPESNYVLEGNTQTFLVKLWKNGTVQSDVFVFDLLGSNTVPAANFDLTFVDGNNFTVRNIRKYLTSSLPIKCTSGSNERTLNINLRGAW